MASLDQIMQAVNDGLLRQRLTAAAQRRGIANPEAWVTSSIGSLVGRQLPTHGQGQELADMRAYGDAQRAIQQEARDAYIAQAPAVVEASDPIYVTDDQLLEAVDRVAGALN